MSGILESMVPVFLFATHIGGAENDLADALSWGKHEYSLSQHPQAQQRPAALPPELLDLTIVQKPDSTSSLWTDLWTSIFGLA